MFLILPLAIAGVLLLAAGLFLGQQSQRVRVALAAGGLVLIILPLLMTYVRGGQP